MYRTVIERVTISLPRLPKEFEGTTVAVVSDIHAGPGRGRAARAKHTVEIVANLAPDVIVLPGDTVHAVRDANACLSALGELKAPYGIWASLGNHEHGFVWFSKYVGPAPEPPIDEWRRVYGELGIELLVNEARPIEKNGARIWLLGVDDAYSGRDNLAAALATVETDDLRLAITHSPDLLDDPRIGEVDLLLAGHTHGGQVRLPGLGPLCAPCRRPRERSAGLIRANGTLMYVTRGAGEGTPIRLLCPREVTLITLASDAQGSAGSSVTAP
jgi:predicted MPP superfamily phosphohydrolase